MTEVQQLARFVAGTQFSQLSDSALEQLKIRVLDTIGVAIGALEAEPIRAIRRLTERLGGNGAATLIGGGSSAPDRAAFYNVALSRYLDFMDSYLAPGETCHPSDNLGAVLAAAESVGASGEEFLTALASAYQVQIRLSDVAPVRAKGFDHTVQGAYAVAAGVCRAMGLSAEQTANAIAISGTANNALRVTRTGDLSHWKGLAYPQVAKEGTHAALLAEVGITGPQQVFEGNKGFKETIAGDFSIDWSAENLEGVLRTIVKKHNSEIHSQSAIDAALTIRERVEFDPAAVSKIRVTTFQVAYDIIGGGEEGDKRDIHTKEEADHSLPYLIAVALLDGEVTPAQYAPERILASDVQELLQRVEVRPDDTYSAQFPEAMPARVDIEMADGSTSSATTSTYRGFHTDPLDWEGAREKFDRLTAPYATPSLREEITAVIKDLEHHRISDLTGLLTQVAPLSTDPLTTEQTHSQQNRMGSHDYQL